MKALEASEDSRVRRQSPRHVNEQVRIVPIVGQGQVQLQMGCPARSCGLGDSSEEPVLDHWTNDGVVWLGRVLPARNGRGGELKPGEKLELTENRTAELAHVLVKDGEVVGAGAVVVLDPGVIQPVVSSLAGRLPGSDYQSTDVLGEEDEVAGSGRDGELAIGVGI